MLAISVVPLIGALHLSAGGHNPLGDCRFQAMFGFPAPSCGLTRSFVALTSGHFNEAITYHLFGPALFAGCVGFALQGLTELLLWRPLRYGYRWIVVKPALTGRSLAIFGVLFLAYYGLRLYARYQLVAGQFDSELIQGFITGAQLL